MNNVQEPNFNLLTWDAISVLNFHVFLSCSGHVRHLPSQNSVLRFPALSPYLQCIFNPLIFVTALRKGQLSHSHWVVAFMVIRLKYVLQIKFKLISAFSEPANGASFRLISSHCLARRDMYLDQIVTEFAKPSGEIQIEYYHYLSCHPYY